MSPETTQPEPPDYATLLREVVTVPGRMAACYSAFHGYSLGNQMLAAWQCASRDIPIGPIASYTAWQGHGRQVRKGERAIRLYMPVTVKVREERAEAETEPADRTFTKFILRPNWFTVGQTDPIPGKEQSQPEPLAGWNVALALTSLGICEKPYEMLDGNCQGYAKPREHTIAINPLADHATRTRIHEIAHCLLHGDSDTTEPDTQDLTRNEKELEAETTAYLVSAALGLPGADESRAYVQNWYGTGATIPDKLARRIMGAADKILTAGRPTREQKH